MEKESPRNSERLRVVGISGRTTGTVLLEDYRASFLPWLLRNDICNYKPGPRLPQCGGWPVVHATRYYEESGLDHAYLCKKHTPDFVRQHVRWKIINALKKTIPGLAIPSPQNT